MYMKTILRHIVGLAAGIVAGLAIGATIAVLFTDTTLPQFIERLLSLDSRGALAAALVGIVSFGIAVAILIPVHEAGHLVCGLLTGYRFVSFRIFSLTFIKADGRLRIKKYAVAGTGGQCLLTPPDLPLGQIPTGWYNAGGVLANLLLLLLALPLFMIARHPLVVEALFIFCLVDLFMIVTNGIPMKFNGISNDGYNIIHLNRNPLGKQAVILQLRANSMIQNGVRPKDLPDGWFEWRTDIDFRNPLEVSLPLMHASRLLDSQQWEEAYREFAELYSHRSSLLQLYVNEIACELAFCALVTGRKEEAERLLDPKLRKYIDTYRKVMSSKQRLSCAIAYLIDGDAARAREIYGTLCNDRARYLLQGEVESDLALMGRLLGLAGDDALPSKELSWPGPQTLRGSGETC